MAIVVVEGEQLESWKATDGQGGRISDSIRESLRSSKQPRVRR